MKKSDLLTAILIMAVVIAIPHEWGLLALGVLAILWMAGAIYWYIGYIRKNPSIWQMRLFGIKEQKADIGSGKEPNKIEKDISWKWFVVGCVLAGIIGYIGYKLEHHTFPSERDWITEGQRMTNAIEVFRTDLGRYPTNLVEIYPKYYKPSKQSEIDWGLILYIVKYSPTNDTYELKNMPYLQ
jgi:hypothetical protein